MESRAGGEGTNYLFKHTKNQQTSFSSFVFDTCANSFVFLFGRRKGDFQEHTQCFELGTGLQTLVGSFIIKSDLHIYFLLVITMAIARN